MDGADRVIVVVDFYDGPRSGIATFRSQPFAFECIFSDELDDYTDRYLLMEIEPELAQAAVERQALFLRWSTKVSKGEIPLSYERPLVLPADRERYDQLTALIGDRLKPTAERSIVARGKFGRIGTEHHDFAVVWHEVADTPPPSP
jgi:hypothetical protein